MPLRQITHEAYGLKAVMRERSGADVFDAVLIQKVLVDYCAKQIKPPLKSATDLPNHLWQKIFFVTYLIQQTVSLEGKDRFDIPAVDAPAEDIIEFFEFVMGLPARVITFFQEAVSRFDELPNPDGGPEDPALNDESAESQMMTETLISG